MSRAVEEHVRVRVEPAAEGEPPAQVWKAQLEAEYVSALRGRALPTYWKTKLTCTRYLVRICSVL